MATVSEFLADGLGHHQAGRFPQAEKIYRQILQADSEQADAWHLLGVIAHQEGRHREAVGYIRRAIASNPRAATFHGNLGLAYRMLGKPLEAVASYERALEIDANFTAAHNNLGNVLKDQGKLNEAIASYRRALKIEPGYVKAHNNLAMLLDYQGKPEEAAACCERALKSDPQCGDTLVNLAVMCRRHPRLPAVSSLLDRGLKVRADHPHLNLAAARLDEQDGRIADGIDRLRRVQPAAESDVELSANLSFLLAELLDRAGDPAQAFAEAVAANSQAMQSTNGWYARRQRYLRVIDSLTEVFTQAWVDSWTAAAPVETSQTPVFLVGLPRSGVTLLGAMLDGHPTIRSLEEKPAVFQVQKAVEARPQGYPRALANLEPADVEALRTIYSEVADASIARRPGHLLLDRLPLNMIHAGLILRLFPAARFIVVVRHPYDTCLSSMMHNFGVNAATANFFTLEDAAALFCKVTDLYQQYTSVLPHACHVVRYEDLVEDFEPHVRGVLEFLGVEWDDGVVDYIERARIRGAAAPPNYDRAVQPIHTRSRYRWRRYVQQLAPVAEELRGHVELMGYQASRDGGTLPLRNLSLPYGSSEGASCAVKWARSA